MVSKRFALAALAGFVAIAAFACTTEKIVEVTVEREVIRTVQVEVPVEVEREVVREVEIEVPVEIEREVIREVEVEVPVEIEKEVVREVRVEVTRTIVEVATATPIPTATPLPIQAIEPAPQPNHEYGEIRVAVFNIAPGVGLGSAQAPVEAMQYWGVGEGLFAVDDDGRTVGKLALDWELAPDLSMATINLREDVIFHDGYGGFTADDVVFTMNDSNANTNPTSIHGQAGDFAAIFGETAKIDDYTVQFNFTEGGFDPRWNGNFLNEQAQGTTFFSKAAHDQNGVEWLRENIVSTGPFEVVEWVQDDRAVLSAVDYDHWFATPEIQTLRFTEVPEPSSRVAFLRTGDADIADAVPLKDIRPLVESGFKAERASPVPVVCTRSSSPVTTGKRTTPAPESRSTAQLPVTASTTYPGSDATSPASSQATWKNPGTSAGRWPRPSTANSSLRPFSTASAPLALSSTSTPPRATSKTSG